MATVVASIPDDTEIFQQLETYPWDKDAEFQGGLSAILGPATDPSQIQELTLRAQVFYLSRKKSIPIDFDAYKTYLSSKDHQPQPSTMESPPPPPPYSITPITSESGSSNTPDTNQTLAQNHSQAAVQETIPEKPVQAPYPPTFAEIVSLITSGAPIPGIKEIPPTLLTEQATKPIASKRRKPWEKEVSDDVIEGKEGTFGDRRDEFIVQEFPE